MKNRLLFICFSLIPSLLFAQQATMPSVQLGAGIGQIFKHTTNFKPPVRGITVLTEATYEWQTAGAAAWHTTHRYPVVGLTLSYADFGDNEIFGQAIGIFPSLSFSNRWKQKRFYSFLRIGFGIAYLTKPYNEISNPLNNVIGSHWNNITDARGGVGFRLTPQFELLAGGSFTHYSDASAQLPNLGINVPAPFLALRYSPNPVSKYIDNEQVMPDFRWHGLFIGSYAVREAIALGGPKYAVLNASAGAMYDLDKKHHLYALLDYEFSEVEYKWAKNQIASPLENEMAYIAKSSRYSIAFGDEFRFGQFGFSTTFGFYLPGSAPAPWFMYEKLGWRYYFLPKSKIHPFLNANLKAHEITAECFYFGAGLQF